jgi:archaellum component FlaC
VGNDKVPTVKYSVSNQINAQNESLALVKKLQTASKELNRIELQLVEIRKTVVPSNAADGIQLLKDTLGELLLVDSQYLEYRRISDQLGKINPLYSVTAEIEKDVARLAGIRKRLEATIEKLREIIAQRTTA